MTQKIRKAVFPVAGLGTRFLPATKAVPKEMLTIYDRPALQLVVEEAQEAGIEQFIFVTGRNKQVIEDHFDVAFELNETLAKREKTDTLEMLTDILPEAGSTMFVRQQEPKGLGHAVWCARHLVGDEPFAVLLPDVIMRGGGGCCGTMIDVFHQRGGNVISTQQIDWNDTKKYGIVTAGETNGEVFEITNMEEKPEKAQFTKRK